MALRTAAVAAAALIASGLAGAGPAPLELKADADGTIIFEGGGGEGGGGWPPAAPPITNLHIKNGGDFHQIVEWATPATHSYHGAPTSVTVRMGTVDPGANVEGWYASGSSSTVSNVPSPMPGQDQEVYVNPLNQNTKYYYVAKVTYTSGSVSVVSNVASGTTSVDLDNPGQVTNLAVVSMKYDSITVAWTATSDDQSGAGALQANQISDLRVSDQPIDAGNFGSATQVSGMGSPLSPGSYESKILTGQIEGLTLHLAMVVRDDAGKESLLSNSVMVTVPLNDHVSSAAGDGCGGSATGAGGWILAAAVLAMGATLRR